MIKFNGGQVAGVFKIKAVMLKAGSETICLLFGNPVLFLLTEPYLERERVLKGLNNYRGNALLSLRSKVCTHLLLKGNRSQLLKY